MTLDQAMVGGVLAELGLEHIPGPPGDLWRAESVEGHGSDVGPHQSDAGQDDYR